MADISNPPDKDLLECYETVKRKARNNTPNFSTLFMDTCARFPSLFGSGVIVLFDAFDECDPRQQATICALTIANRPQTLWGLTNMMAHDGANRVRRICAIIFAVPKGLLQSPKGP